MPFMKKNNFLTILLLFLLLIACSCAGIAFGSVSLSPGNVVKVLFSTDSSSTASTLVRTVRSPRVLGGLFAGMGLACAGVILQGVMNNSLASPNTIGINSGSGFGVMLALLLFPQKTGLLPVFAFCGALTAALLVFLLAYLGDSSRTTIVLAGITISSFFNAGINTVKILDTEITVNLTSFMAGSLSGLTMKKLLLPCGCVLLAFCLSLFFARSLNILGLGDDIARSLGMRVFLTRFTLLALASILAGCVGS